MHQKRESQIRFLKIAIKTVLNVQDMQVKQKHKRSRPRIFEDPSVRATKLRGLRLSEMIDQMSWAGLTSLWVSLNSNWETLKALQMPQPKKRIRKDMTTARTHPATHLVSLLETPDYNPSTIVDLGCRTGATTAILKERFPAARVIGVDSSHDEIRQAQENFPGVEFVHAEPTTYQPPFSVDLFFSVSEWLWLTNETRIAAFERLLGSQRTGGVLAMSTPALANDLLRRVFTEVTESGPLDLEQRDRSTAEVPEPSKMIASLAPVCSAVTIGLKLYRYVLGDENATETWMDNTNMKPYLDRLDGEDRQKSPRSISLASESSRIRFSRKMMGKSS
ncbi:S-adenosyl-L-methionine-dependent methyltransferase [Aspergillus saccharolyticus JOP 1030-1]|uniref:S-adenosyl-L-methionine-dependent methyltransferase n=1 Tax=Aspergillus saccharolyticus JOP 1030-1 TaxID=1450539 RepID=A0A318ZLK0_9EURO|nr:S-adenosyl-L-methionine-dependent methyltransferase [Aspergillus saccharolyticus JOP 1030-1]PYH44680.1 S-adenosyl-L-methionine-dependent methyltransferase [Aspergillus saccharolyticus JOP 1030-1]